ncbi:MAG: heme NO-binding domain-containing protein [Candidatus Hydrogenedentota bacterium]
MKGVIFQILEQVIVQEHGEDAWEGLLDAAELDGAYTSLASYPDEHLFKLVAAASAALQETPQRIIRRFGRKAFPHLAGKYPLFLTPHNSTIPFLLTLNDIIHPEVRKLYPGADVPEFDFSQTADRILILGYSSRRKLCALAEGLIEGAAEHYGERVLLEQTSCMHRGDDKCVIRCSFERIA